MSGGSRPQHWSNDQHELYDAWLVPNGIDGLLPEDVTFEVDTKEKTITYNAFRTVHGPGRGTWDPGEVVLDDQGFMIVDWVTVPLLVPPNRRVHDLVGAFSRGPATRDISVQPAIVQW